MGFRNFQRGKDTESVNKKVGCKLGVQDQRSKPHARKQAGKRQPQLPLRELTAWS